MTLGKGVPRGALEETTKTILTAYGRFYKEHPMVRELTAEVFVPYFHMLHPKMEDAKRSLLTIGLQLAFAEPVPHSHDALIPRLAEARLALDIQTINDRYAAGDDIDVVGEVRNAHERVSEWAAAGSADPQCLTDIGSILEQAANDEGLQWRWPSIRDNLKPMRPGDFYIFAAGVDSGKTSALADNVTYMAPQLDIFYEEPRDILWLNNEGDSDRIVERLWQAALNLTLEQMIELARIPADPEHAECKTMLRQRYKLAMGGRMGVLRVMSIHNWDSGQVERLVRKYRPGLVVADMIDNITFSGQAKGERTDQALEAQYQWFRQLGVTGAQAAPGHGFPVIATSQVNGDASFLPYPAQTQLKDSRVGKQGAADVIITMGRVEDVELERSRYIGCSKNKRARTGKPKSPRREVQFDFDRSRFRDPTEARTE
jgi:replicative DNA helicase